jgi:hypothetical protein
VSSCLERRVLVGGIRVREGVTVAVGVSVTEAVDVKLGVAEGLDVGGIVRVGVAVSVGVNVAVAPFVGVTVSPPVMGITSSESSVSGNRMRVITIGILNALMATIRSTT